MALTAPILKPPAIPCVTYVKEDTAVGCTFIEVGISLKSSLKKHRFTTTLEQQAVLQQTGATDAGICEVNKRRSVQWIDSHGKALIDLREFEPSDMGDSEEEDIDIDPLQACSCVIQ